MTRASDTARILSGGAVINEDGNDVDFRVESDTNANMLFVDGGNNRVGIGDDAPNRLLQLKALGTGDTQKATIMFENEVGTTGSIGQGDSSNNAMIFTENGSERMRIASDGRVGIGTSSSDQNLMISDTNNIVDHNINDINKPAIGLQNTDTSNNTASYINFKSAYGHDVVRLSGIRPVNSTQTSSNTGAFAISTRNASSTLAERMRISSNGRVLVGATSDTGFRIVSTASGTEGCLDCVSSSTNGYYALRIDMHANNNYAQLFRQGGSVVGTILTSSGSTSYNTSSDYRLKENVTYEFDATSRLKQLKPCRFNFKIDADKTKDGFLAHEVQTIVPEAVSGEKDAVDADGNIDPQGIDQSKLVPLLVKTIQELEARITALESK